MINQETLNKFVTWTNVVGIFSIVIGALSALSGVFAFLIGAIPGVIMIIMGIKLLNAKKAAQELLGLEDANLVAERFNLLLAEVTTYFKIQGILYIISVVLGILGIIIGFSAFAAIMSQMGSFY